jgi:predicted nucleotidyltransferase
LLAALLLHPGREASISELAVEVGTNPGNLHGEVERLVSAGILADRRVGRTRLIHDAGSIYSRALTDLLQLAYGPKPLLEAALRDVPNIEAAYLFGSWAARYDGEPGALPNDIDLLIIGNPDRDDTHEIAAEVGRQLQREVQVVFRTPKAWVAADDAFAATVRSRPLVPLDLAGGPA